MSFRPSEPPRRLWIVILNWNRRQDTLDCLTSLVGQSLPAGLALHTLVVDNGSRDGSAEAVQAAFPGVELLALPANLGYARGVNAGLRLALEAGADWTLLLNNDTVAEPGLVAALVEAALASPDIGMLAPTVVYHDRPSQVWPSAGWRRRLTLAAFDSTADPPSREPYDVDWATGCCLLVRRQLWEQVGPLDPGFRVYYEDHDLCLRARGRLAHPARAGGTDPAQGGAFDRRGQPGAAVPHGPLQRALLLEACAGSAASAHPRLSPRQPRAHALALLAPGPAGGRARLPARPARRPHRPRAPARQE